jgi:hypothetical protein
MAAGKPLLFIGPAEATPGLIIGRSRCGWQITPGDVPALIALLEDLAVRREEAGQYGRRAREVFEQHYDLPDGVARVAAALGAGTPEAAPGWAPELC